MKLLEEREIVEEIISNMDKHKIIYLVASVGFGKTTTIEIIQEKLKEKFIWCNVDSCEYNKFNIKELDEKINNDKSVLKKVVIDNFEYLYDLEIRRKLIKYIKQSPKNVMFFINSKSKFNKEFKDLYLENKLIYVDSEKLKFNKSEIKEYYVKNNIIQNDYNEIEKVFEMSKGYPIVLNIIAKYIQEKELEEVKDNIENDFLDYLDIKIFNELDEEIIKMIAYIFQIDDVNVENIKKIDKINDAEKQIEKLQVLGILEVNKYGEYSFNNIVQVYLEKRIELILEEKEKEEINYEIGKLYEEQKKITKALKHYVIAKKYEKVCEILNEQILEHIGIVNDNTELKNILLSIPESIVIKYPYLCANIAIIYSLSYNIGKFEEWLDKLKKMKINKCNTNLENKIIEECISYCKVSSPNINNIELIFELRKMSRLSEEINGIKQKMTLTGNQPTLLSGSKDICNWSKKYEFIASIIPDFLENIFGKLADGAANIGIGEIMYQRNELEKASIKILKGIAKSQSSKNIDVMFVGYIVLAKIMFGRSSSQEYKNELEYFENEIVKSGAKYLMNNYAACKVRFAIIKKDIDTVNKWLESAPDIKLDFNTLSRYQYFTKVRADIFKGDYNNANIALDMLYEYIITYKRTFYEMEYYILKAIIMNKLNQDEEMKENIEKALLLSQKFGYIRIFVDEGEEILKILKKYEGYRNKNIKQEYFKEIEKECEKFVSIHYGKDLGITKAEFKILELIDEGYSNDEIAKSLYISKATVKTHINHIYAKINVKNRIQAIRKYKEIKG